MSTNWECRARETQRKRESRRQASEAQREKGQQRSRARDKNKGHIFVLEEQHENFVTAVTKWELLAATNARWKWAAVKKKVNEKTYDISSIKCVTKMFLAPVVQTLDSAIHRIKIYPVDNAIGSPNTYPLDSDLSSG